VQSSALVRLGQTAAKLLGDGDGLDRRQTSLLPEKSLEVTSCDILHRDERRPLGQIELENPGDVSVDKAPLDPELAANAFECLCLLGDLGFEGLERHLPFHSLVKDPVDGPQRARSQLFDDPEPFTERRPGWRLLGRVFFGRRLVLGGRGWSRSFGGSLRSGRSGGWNPNVLGRRGGVDKDGEQPPPFDHGVMEGDRKGSDRVGSRRGRRVSRGQFGSALTAELGRLEVFESAIRTLLEAHGPTTLLVGRAWNWGSFAPLA
jgi:hypothetical protein